MKHFLLKIIILFLFSLVSLASNHSNCLFAQMARIDSLKETIKAKEDSLRLVKKEKAKIETEFQRKNIQIYQYKKRLLKENNPFLEYRLKQLLKNSQELANKLEKMQQTIRHLQSILQMEYRNLIEAINTDIQKHLNSLNKTKKGLPHYFSELDSIQSLEKEKNKFTNKLHGLPTQDTDWQKITIEPQDTPDKIQTKLAILQDKLLQFDKILREENQNLEQLKKDLSIYKEMLTFYLDLNQTIDEEREYFDRNRMDELRDWIDATDSKIEKTDRHIQKLTNDRKKLQIKIRYFLETIHKRENEHIKRK